RRFGGDSVEVRDPLRSMPGWCFGPRASGLLGTGFGGVNARIVEPVFSGSRHRHRWTLPLRRAHSKEPHPFPTFHGTVVAGSLKTTRVGSRSPRVSGANLPPCP